MADLQSAALATWLQRRNAANPNLTFGDGQAADSAACVNHAACAQCIDRWLSRAETKLIAGHPETTVPSSYGIHEATRLGVC